MTHVRRVPGINFGYTTGHVIHFSMVYAVDAGDIGSTPASTRVVLKVTWSRTMTYNKSSMLTGLLAALSLTLASSAALATVATGDRIGNSEAEIRAQLSAQGYKIKAVEIESDEIEVEVTLGDKEYEIEIDKTTGQVTEVEEED